MFRENYDVLVSTRVDQNAKDILDKLAARKRKKLGELLREIILEAVEKAQPLDEPAEKKLAASPKRTDR